MHRSEDRPSLQPYRGLRGRAKRATWGGAVAALALTLFAVAPLTYPGFFQAQSGFAPAYNVQHPLAAPNWGESWFAVHGEGVLPYLLAWPVYRLSGSGVLGIRWGYALALLVGSLAVYVWSRRWLGVQGAVLAATVYTYLPWHLSAVYVRGAYAEAWLWALAPLLLFTWDRVSGGRGLVYGLLGALLAGSLLFVQPGLAALFLAVSLAYGILLRAPGPLWPGRAAAIAILVGGLIGTGYLVSGSPGSPTKDLLYPYQLLTAAWDLAPAALLNGAGGLGQSMTAGTSYQIGIAGVGLTIVAIALWAGGRGFGGNAQSQDSLEEAATAPGALPLGRALAFWLAVLVLVVLLTLRPSAAVWRITHLDAYVAHAWQLLALAGLPLAFLAGSVVRLDRRLATLAVWAGLLALTVLASYPYLAPRFTQVEPGAAPLARIQAGEAARPQVLLLDAAVAPVSEITSTLAVTLTWQALEPVPQDYTAFVHVLANDQKVAQGDGLPCVGKCRTFTWQPGEIVVDVHEIQWPSEIPPGPYRLGVGLYMADTGERAAVAGRDDGTVYVDVR